MRAPIVFSGSPLDRADAKRRDAAWIAEQLVRDDTRVLPVWQGNVLVRRDETRLAWATPALLDERPDSEEPPALLGLGDGVAHFALDLSSEPDPVASMGWEGVASFPELRAVAAQLPPGDAAIAAQARHLLDWHRRHRFCSVCGEPSRPTAAGWSRGCREPGCSAEHFPRTDPVVIMLVADEDRCLLGRQAGWPHPFHSALAGFVEPGESLEEAVRREVAEEAGITVGNVRYLASQPWPFPASLMIGCVAEPLSDAIELRDEELEAAAWFTRAEVRASLDAPTPILALPPPMAIAHHLIRAWNLEGAKGAKEASR